MKTTIPKLSFMMFLEWFIWGHGSCRCGRFSAKRLSPVEIAGATPVPPSLPSCHRFWSARWLTVSSSTESVMLLTIAGAILMFFAAQQTHFSSFPLLLLYALTYMPTIALTNSIAFSHVGDVERDYPRIRVMGTIGWIASGIACGFLPPLLGFGDISASNVPLLITAASSLLLGLFALTLPATEPKSTGSSACAWRSASTHCICLKIAASYFSSVHSCSVCRWRSTTSSLRDI